MAIEGQEISEGLTDITPYYWSKAALRYFISRRGTEGPVVVETLPQYSDTQTYLVGKRATDVFFGPNINLRTVVIPTDTEVMAISGPGPRFDGQVCIHELIAQTNQG